MESSRQCTCFASRLWRLRIFAANKDNERNTIYDTTILVTGIQDMIMLIPTSAPSHDFCSHHYCCCRYDSSRSSTCRFSRFSTCRSCLTLRASIVCCPSCFQRVSLSSFACSVSACNFDLSFHFWNPFLFLFHRRHHHRRHHPRGNHAYMLVAWSEGKKAPD